MFYDLTLALPAAANDNGRLVFSNRKVNSLQDLLGPVGLPDIDHFNCIICFLLFRFTHNKNDVII